MKILFFHLNRNFLLASLTKMKYGSSLKVYYQQHMQMGSSKKDFFHNFMYGKLDGFLVPLEMYKYKVQTQTNIDDDKIHVVPLGIELDRFTVNRPDKKKARQYLNLRSDKYMIGVVGRLDPKKGQHILIEAAAILKRDGYDFDILLIGDKTLNESTGYEKKLDQLVRTHNLDGQVFYRNHIEMIENGYAALDMFVLTSLSETYGMVTIEAMASGLPVIATDSGGTPGIIKNNYNGLLVKPEHPYELAAKIKELIDNRELADRLRDQAEKDAVHLYAKETQVNQLEKLFSAG